MRDLTTAPYGKFVWFVGIVEDTLSDPTQLGRVRVRAVGFHPSSAEAEDLPWAPVLNGGSAKINPGQMVLGFFMDGEEAQQPFILGVINGGVESVGARFFGAISNVFKDIASDIKETITAFKPNPVPGSCPDNPGGKIKDANGTLDTSTLVQIGVTSGARSQSDKNNPAFLKKEAAEAYLAMVAAAKADGISWVINSAYRTYESQQKEKLDQPGLAARAGYSKHGCGLAVDLGTQIYNRAPYRWLMKNGPKFGFNRIYLSGYPDSAEAWHWQYSATQKKPKIDNTPETTPDGRSNIHGEQVKKKPTVVGDKP